MKARYALLSLDGSPSNNSRSRQRVQKPSFHRAIDDDMLPAGVTHLAYADQQSTV
jgi:hypothetical protein